MREKQRCVLVTFYTTAEAMATEKLCRERGMEGRLVPVPRSITADCGIAWRAPAALREELETAIRDARIEIEGLYDAEF